VVVVAALVVAVTAVLPEVAVNKNHLQDKRSLKTYAYFLS
jgi:hypothetical protein